MGVPCLLEKMDSQRIQNIEHRTLNVQHRSEDLRRSMFNGRFSTARASTSILRISAWYTLKRDKKTKF